MLHVMYEMKYNLCKLVLGPTKSIYTIKHRTYLNVPYPFFVSQLIPRMLRCNHLCLSSQLFKYEQLNNCQYYLKVSLVTVNYKYRKHVA